MILVFTVKRSKLISLKYFYTNSFLYTYLLIYFYIIYLYRIRFGSISLKCRDCRICVHPDCKFQLNMVCVPQSAGTPTAKGQMGIISDYTPNSGPMVPGILVHCVNEVILIQFLKQNKNHYYNNFKFQKLFRLRHVD